MVTTFTDYAFYRDVFKGKLSEDAYNASAIEAYAEILSQTFSRAKNAPDSMTEAVKLCECALVDVIDAYKVSNAELPIGLSSVTNDKMSVSRNNGGGSSELSEERSRKNICRRYLQMPENLMCRWA